MSDREYSNQDSILRESRALLKTETMSQNRDNLTFYDVFMRISKLAIPMGISFTYSFEVFLSVVFLNTLAKSSDEVAATTLVSVFMNTFCVISFSPLFAVALLLSEKLGVLQRATPDNKKIIVNQVSCFNANSLFIAFFISTPMAFFPLFFSKYLLTIVFHQNIIVASYAQDFLRIYAFAIPALMARMSLEQIMFGFGKAWDAMWIGISSFIIGVLIAASLGFGIISMHIPKMGLQGIAFGFVIESYLIAIAYGTYVYTSTICRDYNFFYNMWEKSQASREQFYEILSVGSAIMFSNAVDLFMVLAVGIFSGLLGTSQQAAMSFIMQFIYFQFIFLSAFSFSCSQEMKREIGARRFHHANQIAKYGLNTTIIFMLPLPIIFAAFPQLLEVVNGSLISDVSNILCTLGPIMSIAVVADAFRFNLLQQLRGCNDLSIPNVIAIGGMASVIALSILLGFKTSMGINGVAAGYALALVITSLALGIRWSDRTKLSKIGESTNQEICASISGFFSRSRSQSDSTALLSEEEGLHRNSYSSISSNKQ